MFLLVIRAFGDVSDIRDGWWLMITRGDQTWQREMNMFIQIMYRSIELAHFPCWQCMDSKNGPMAIDTSAYGYGPTIDFEKTYLIKNN